jgi:glutamyl/glutaminyl-tRNA synthetase
MHSKAGKLGMQVLIYEAIGAQAPVFGHMSLILAPDKSKLSKRHGATSVGEFKQQGFLPTAMVNYLSLLGVLLYHPAPPCLFVHTIE